MNSTFLSISILLLAANAVSAKAWRGIEPLHSTRADVERLLGPSIDKSPYTSTYDFPEERVSISFSSGVCEEGLPGGWKLPKDTVVQISIDLKAEKKIAEFLTPGKEYEQIRAAHTQHVYYIDSAEGITFQVWDGLVQNMMYGPSAKDKGYSCGEYKYAAPIPPGSKLKRADTATLDSFGNIRFIDAKSRLDNFAIQLSQMRADDSRWRGYIIVYAGRRSYLGEAQFKVNCYKNYLVRVRGTDAGSLFVVNGGFREDAQTELYIGRADYYPPVLWPTLSPKKAQIINRRLRSCHELSP